jgi:Cu2+-exporting ATPase
MTDCTLCGLETGTNPVSEDGTEKAFCCQGCLEVAQIVETDGDVDFSVADIRARAETKGSTDAPGDSDASSDVDGETAYLAMDGMHCKTCEGFIELLADEREGINSARANYATEMVQLTYDPELIDRQALSETVSRYGYRASDPEEGNEETRDRLEFERYRAAIAVVLLMTVMIPYLLFIYPTYVGIYPESFLYGPTISAMVFAPLTVWSTLVLIGLGYPIFRGAYVSLRVGQPNMDVLIALAVLAAYLYSVATFASGGRDLYFDVAVMVLVVVTVGNHIESKVKRAALGSRSALTESRVTTASRRSEDGTTETIDIEACEPGDKLLVKPGERIPVDGTVHEGSAAVDEGLVTGESIPQPKSVDDEVLGGSIVTDSALVVEVGDAAESTMDRLVELLWDVQSTESGIQRQVNRFAVIFVPLVLVLAAATAVGWLSLGLSIGAAVLIGVSVLVISCPCSLGIATPLALASGTRDASEKGILILNETVLERITDTDIVVFDKTGTLTTGEMSVVDVAGEDPETLLSMAATVEGRSSHPVAAAIEAAAPASNTTIEGFQRSDRAVSATVDGRNVTVGHPSTFDADDWTVPSALATQIETAYDDGLIPTVVGWDGEVQGVISVADTPRENWEEVVAEVAAAGREIVLLTGDDERMTQRFAEHPDIDTVFAGVRPESKEAIVGGLGERGTTTMIGDGTNDAPALASADLGIALSGGTELAVEAADAVIMDNDLNSLPVIFELARSTRRRITGNLGWAIAYNLIALPLAIVGVINPLIAAIAMGVSSLVVVFNSKRRLIEE